MSTLESIFDAGINLLRGDIGSFGDLIFQVYAGRFGFDFEPALTTGEMPKVTAKPSLKVLTFDNFNRRTRARYARHQLINKTSLLEKVGDEPDEITLDVKLVRDLGVKPEEEIELIRGYIKDGTAESLIIGSEVLGEFVITELSEGRTFVDCFGRTQVAELSLTFEETGAAEQTETAPSTDLPLIWL